MKRREHGSEVKKSFTQRFDLIRDILRLVEAGYYPSKIARVLGTYKQLINYYLKKLEKAGYIRKEVRDRITVYSLTEKGKKFLAGVEGLPGRRFRLHNFRVLYPVLVDARVPVDWGKVVRLRNWRQYVGTFLNVTVRRNEGRRPSIEILAEPLEGDDPYQLLYMALRECDKVAEYLEQKFGMKLGRGRIVGRPHWAVYDPIAKKFSDYMVLSDDVGQIDKSPPSPGEIDFFSPEAAKNYLIAITTMPSRVKSIEEEVKAFRSIMAENTLAIREFAEQIRVHLDVMRGLREDVRRLSSVIERLEKILERLESGVSDGYGRESGSESGERGSRTC